jgi:outer membrane lipoprotein-sorting protein
MTNRGRVATPVVLLILGIYAISVAPAAAGLLETFDKSLRTTKDVTAVFTQTRHSPLLEEPIEADGKLWIRFPGDVRFEYETPDPMTLLKHADTTWLYVPALEQVIEISYGSAKGFPSRYTIYEESGEVVDIRLRQVKRNTGVKAGRFSAEWPPGIEIITLGE